MRKLAEDLEEIWVVRLAVLVVAEGT